jgi:predicted ATPase/class 3 adenylate cyclase
MECGRCRADNRHERRYCSDCGAPLTSACAVCGFTNQAGERFCGGCGATLALLQAPVAGDDPPRRARAGGPTAPALQSERKHVTVLFADLRGSLELLADRDPEEAQAVLEPVLEGLIRAVHRHGGTVNQVLGDGIMALFGAPVAYEDHALRACAAALDLQNAVGEVSERLQRERGVEVKIRVGMNSGEVVVRATIADFQKDYSAVGETTHVAARVEQLAAPGTVTLTAQTLRLVEGLVDVVALGQFPVKGLAQPIALYRLVGLPPAQSRMRGARLRTLSRFVGRDAELETLRRAITEARHGRGQLVAVIGEPGLGKSRLLLEIMHSAAVEGALVLETGAEAYGRTGAFVPLVELLQSYLRLRPGDTAATIEAAVRGKLQEVRAGDAAATALVALLAPTLEPPGRPETGSERRAWMLAAVWELLAAEARRQPIVLVIEDLQWLDVQTQAFVDLLVDRLGQTAVALLVSYRSDYQPRWSGSGHTQIHLDRLAPADVNMLLDTLIGDDPSLESLKQTLEQHTDGNPLFMEETVRALIESRVLTGDPGRYRLAAAAPEVRIPASVHAVLAARVDGLPADAKRVLQCAAVIGRHVPRTLLLGVTELSSEEVERVLDHLRRAAFFGESSRHPSPEDVFRHALTHEVVYGTLVQDRRRALHERVLHALERGLTVAGGDRVEQLAHHAVRAEAWGPAVTYLRQAAALAVARSADADAVRHLATAIEAVGRLPETPETLTQTIDVRLELRNALLPTGERERIFRSLVEAEAVARRLGDRRRLGWISGYLAPHLWGTGDYEHALRAGQEALATAQALGDLALAVIANRYLGHVHYSLGDYRRAARLLRQSVTSLNDDIIRRHFSLPFMTSIATGSWLVLTLAELGEFAEAVERGVHGVETAERAGHAYSVAAASCGLALTYLRQREVERAIASAERALELSRRRAFSGLVGWASAMLGYAYALAGKTDEAVHLLETGTELAQKTQVKVGESLIAAALAEAYLLAGRGPDGRGRSSFRHRSCARRARLRRLDATAARRDCRGLGAACPCGRRRALPRRRCDRRRARDASPARPVPPRAGQALRHGRPAGRRRTSSRSSDRNVSGHGGRAGSLVGGVGRSVLITPAPPQGAAAGTARNYAD